MATDWALTVKNLVFPQFCKECGRRLLTEENGFFCPTCWEMSPRIEPPFCPICGRPHPPVAGTEYSPRLRLCAACSASPDGGRHFRRLRAAAYYQGPIAEAIKLLKFNDRPRLAAPLAELMAHTASDELECAEYDLIIPVPLHRVRLRARGFNQSQLLAQEIASQFPNAALDTTSLERIRPTRVQSRLASEEDRRANVEGAFAVIAPAPLTGAAVLLVDDVVTSGGTVSVCAQVLREAGASDVDILAAALAVQLPHTP